MSRAVSAEAEDRPEAFRKGRIMVTKVFQCSVITPERRIYDGEAEMVIIPAHDGEIGIMANHAPLLCMLGAGELRVHNGNRHEYWFIDAGFAQVVGNRLIVLTQKSIPTRDLNLADAEHRLAEAGSMSVSDDVDARRKAQAEAAARAQIRLARR